jgi:hypothetical protein
VRLVSKAALDGLRQQAADAARERDAAVADAARQADGRRDAETRLGVVSREIVLALGARDALTRELDAARADAGQVRRELTAERDRRANDLAAEILRARDYLWEVAAGRDTTVSSRYGLCKDAEETALIQKAAAVLEEFLAEGFGDLADLRTRVAALRRADADGRRSLTDVLTRAQFIYLYLAGHPAEITLRSWENAWYENIKAEPDGQQDPNVV